MPQFCFLLIASSLFAGCGLLPLGEPCGATGQKTELISGKCEGLSYREESAAAREQQERRYREKAIHSSSSTIALRVRLPLEESFEALLSDLRLSWREGNSDKVFSWSPKSDANALPNYVSFTTTSVFVVAGDSRQRWLELSVSVDTGAPALREVTLTHTSKGERVTEDLDVAKGAASVFVGAGEPLLAETGLFEAISGQGAYVISTVNGHAEYKPFSLSETANAPAVYDHFDLYCASNEALAKHGLVCSQDTTFSSNGWFLVTQPSSDQDLKVHFFVK